MTKAPATWPEAARSLAARAGRRARLGAALQALAPWLAGGAVAALLARALGAQGSAWSAAPVALGAALGLVAAARAARRARAPEAGDAAWALDRMADAKGRGLVAATVPGAVGAEAAWASPRIAPPAVRLRPPDGLPLAAGGLLLALVALVVPPRPATSADGAALAGGGGTAAAGGFRDGAEGAAAAESSAARARAAERVRDALGLTPEEAADPVAVAERLRDGEARRAAAEAAKGTDLAESLDARAPEPDEVSRAIVQGARSGDEARRLRRAEASARAGASAAPVPPERRALLERYFAARAAEGSGR